MKKILVLTFYFTPDLCAGAFRAAALVNALQRAGDDDVEIEVVTTMPNRYRSFSAEAPQLEQGRNVTVRRFKTSSHNSGVLDQSQSFAHFARQAKNHTKLREYDLVFATSSRLMTAALGAYIANRRDTPLYLDIRDIFVDTINDAFPGLLGTCILPLFKMLEKFSIRSATTINLVSQGFSDYFSEYTHRNPFRYFTNGIDTEFLNYNYQKNQPHDNRTTILFAGNIGAGQGLEKLIPRVADLLADRYDILVIGDGGAKAKLARACDGKTNVKLLDPVNREELKRFYSKADILLLHLNEYDAFKKVLPSKIFEYAATGKPILAGVSGFAAEFTKKNVDNAAVFQPCDAVAMIRALESLDLSIRNRHEFKEKFSRSNIMDNMARDVLAATADK